MSVKRAFSGPDLPREEDLIRCVHCGLCLNQCPTYRLLGKEADSPRGRLFLIRAAMEGEISELGEDFAQHISMCLQCRACETACPSGVRFGRIIEGARGAMARQRPGGLGERLLKALIFRHLFPYPSRLAFLAGLLTFYQQSGLQWLVRRSGLLHKIPGGWSDKERLLPALAGRSYRLPKGGVAAALGKREHRVALFVGCVNGLAFGEVHEATVRVLARNGCEVVVPSMQCCCGALHAHGGERAEAKALARRNIVAFERLGAEAIIVNAAGCGAMLKEYGELLEDDAVFAERAKSFSRVVRDVSEYLAGLPIRGALGAVAAKATYQDPCHLGHAQLVRQQPRALLKAIPGLDLIELPDADQCCGSAGIYNLTQPALSMKLLEQKVAAIAATGADFVVTANPGCQLQLEQGLRLAGVKAEVVNVVQLLDRAYRKASGEKRE